ncbi:hypothetical protein D3C71_1554860 [compost metagenome]
MKTAAPPPATPSCGKGPQPKINGGDKITRRNAPEMMTRAGTFTLPAPRRAAESKAVIQMGIEPVNTIPE